MTVFKILLLKIVLLVSTIFYSVSFVKAFSNLKTFYASTALNDDIKDKCFLKIHPVHSTIQAAYSCFTNKRCVAVSEVDPLSKTAWIQVSCEVNVTITGHTFLGDSNSTTLWTATPTCPNVEMVYKAKLGHCICANKMIGPDCDTLASGCEELYNYGYTISGNYETSHGRLTCWMTSSRAKTVIMQTVGLQMSNYSLEEYNNGWYINYNNHFIGLNRMYTIIRDLDKGEGVTVRFRAVIIYNGEGIGPWWEYMNFTMGNESQGYKYNYSEVLHHKTGVPKLDEIEDCLETAKGNEFSTWDHDRDNLKDTNCAMERGTGWWFSDCTNDSSLCSPFGLALHSVQNAKDQRILALPGMNASAFPKSDDLKIHLVIIH